MSRKKPDILEQLAQPPSMRPLPDSPPVPLSPPTTAGSIAREALTVADSVIGALNPISHLPAAWQARLPTWTRGGPLGNALNLTQSIHEAKARQVARNVARPRERAEREYGAGIEARIRRAGTPQPRKYR